MSLLDTNVQATWDLLYSAHPEGVELHYTRAAKQCYYGHDIWCLTQALQLQRGQRIIIIGGGFGWGAEELEGNGYGPIVVTDISRWIQANKQNEALFDILDEDCLTQESRLRVLAAVDGSADVVITEDVLPTLEDDAALQLAQAIRTMAPMVAHWVSTITASSTPGLNWKTAEEWKSLVSPDLIVQRGSKVAL